MELCFVDGRKVGVLDRYRNVSCRIVWSSCK